MILRSLSYSTCSQTKKIYHSYSLAVTYLRVEKKEKQMEFLCTSFFFIKDV